jgi:hypothetical protein
MAISPDGPKPPDDEMRSEYDFRGMRGVVRGKYAARYRERLRIVRRRSRQENQDEPRDILVAGNTDWGTKLRQRFGNGSPDDSAWDQVKKRLPVGSQTTGEVVACAPFGVWLDIGVGFPALLEVPEIASATQRRLRIDDYPAEGEIVVARVVGFRDDNRQVYLSQRRECA